MVRNNLKGVACIVLAAFCWGLFPSCSRVLYAMGVPVIQVVAARALIAGAVYFVLGLVHGTFRNIGGRGLLFFFGYGMAAIFSTYLFYALAIQRLSSAVAAILLYTAPAFVIVFSRIFYREPITKAKVVSLVFTGLGGILVVRAYDLSSLKVGGLGILFGVLAGLGYSMLTVIGRIGLRKYSAQANTYLPTMLTAAVFLFTVPSWEIKPIGTAGLLCMLGVGVLGSVLPYLFYMKGLSYGIPGTNAALLANVEPLVATICGVVLFKDMLEWPQLAGMILVLTGAVLPNIRRLFPAKRPEHKTGAVLPAASSR